MPYIPHTESDVAHMLSALKLDTIDQLFDEIPPDLWAEKLEIAEGISEMSATRLMTERAVTSDRQLNFLGAGAYEHFIPAAVWDVVTRGEFMTAYTPYQAEASQGTLQTIYEYQSMITQLTAMDISNASLYDGASALAEALLMAVRCQKKKSGQTILMPMQVHPFYRQVCETIVAAQGIQLQLLPYDEGGQIDQTYLAQLNIEGVVALVIPQPNFFGVLEEVHALTDWAHARGLLVIAQVNPMALAVLVPPGQWGQSGADIAVGEGQPMGVPLASGGPYFGFMTCRESLVRQMPGRIIGRTVDLDGKEGFTLTLQAREQHIRRSKATSNICTNQGLAVTAATVFMSLLGAQGLAEVAQQSHQNCEALIKKVSVIPGVKAHFNRARFHEVVLQLPVAAASVIHFMAKQNIQAGVDLQPFYPELTQHLLVCVTETKASADLSRYVDVLAEAIKLVVAV